MNTSEARSCCQGSPAGQSRLGGYIPSWLRGSRGIALLAIAVVGVGMLSGWPWLVAIGAAPVLLSLLPCAAMCALGFCMMGKGGQTSAPSAGASDRSIGASAPPLLTGTAEAAPITQTLDARDSVTVS